MLISATEFDNKLSQDHLRIALIGMSNIGKSFTAKRIAKVDGFTCYDVDEQIQINMGKTTMDAMAKWMGHPYSRRYVDKAAAYLTLETQLCLTAGSCTGNLVLDTTGSVIHIPDSDTKTLKQQYLIVYIKASSADIDVLINRYYKYPKPTIWGNNYRKISGKTNRESLLACFPDLLKLRAKLYGTLADIIIPASDLANPDLTDADILPLIRQQLPST